MKRLCVEFRDYLAEQERLAGPLPEEFASHVAHCPECASELESYRALAGLLDGYPVPELPENEWKRIENLVVAQVASPGRAVPAAPVPLFQRWLSPVRLGFASAALLAAITVFLFVRPGRAPERDAPLAVRFIQGEVGVQSDPARAETPLSGAAPSKVFAALHSGARVRTAPGSRAGLVLNDKLKVQVEEGTRMEFAELTEERFRFLVQEGSVTVDVDRSLGYKSFIVETENALCRITGTLFRVSAARGADGRVKTGLSVEHGSVEFLSRDGAAGRITVRAGESATLGRWGFSVEEPERAAPRRLSEALASLAPAPKVGGEGFLHLVTEPPACSLAIEGRFRGVAPLWVSLPQGEYTVHIFSAGRRAVEQRIQIKTGQESRLFLALEVMASAAVPDTASIPPGPGTDPRTTAPETRAVPPAPAVDSAALIMGEARRLFSAGRFREALPLLQRCADADFLCAQWLGRALQEVGRTDEAARVFRDLSEDKSAPVSMRDNSLYYLIDLELHIRKDSRAARAALERYTALFPRGYWIEEAWFERAKLIQSGADPAATVRAFEDYLAHAPKGFRNSEALYIIGTMSLTRLNDPARALRAFDRLLGEPGARASREDALFWKGQALFQMGKSLDALTVFQDYLRQYPQGQWGRMCQEKIQSISARK